MLHQDRIAANNAFWREMLDQVPATVLVFRIDEDEQAQLFFVNAHVKQDLGFSTEEYVLASESAGIITSELNGLVDKIAELSHKNNADAPQQSYLLTNKADEHVPFKFDFRIFQSKSSRNNLITVVLFQHNETVDKSTVGATVQTIVQAPLSPLFVAESSVMKAVIEKTEQVVHKEEHVMLLGESFTGKRTLLQRMMKGIRLTYSGLKIVEVDCTDSSPKAVMPEFFDSKIPVAQTDLYLSKERIILAISGFERLGEEDFRRLSALISGREQLGFKTRIMATSRFSAEQLHEQGKLPAEFLYRHLFMNVLIPPLRHRKGDISTLAKKWVDRAVSLLHLPEVNFTEAQLFQLEEQEWPENFKSLFENLKSAVYFGQHGRADIRSKSEPSKKAPKKQETPFESEPEEILSFDNMSRKYLQHVLKKTNGKIYGDDGAAALLKMKPTTLQSKLKKLKVR